MVKAPPTPKGFRDIKPEMAKKRRETINKIVSVLEEYGFVPIETPTIEFAQTLEGKYGEEERLIYKFTDRGGRRLALRYDLTVPLARYVATYNPPLPFRRYQIGQVFRGENPQKGRFREFTQLDFDSVGSSDPKEDALVIAAAVKSLEVLGIKNFKVLINDREILKIKNTSLLSWYDSNTTTPDDFDRWNLIIIRAIDKLKKVGEAEVIKEIVSNTDYTESQAKRWIYEITGKQPTEKLQKIFTELQRLDISQDKYEFSPTLARGLDYYTGMIFEIEIEGYSGGSVGAGGRYDNLIGSFAKKDIPAVGFSFGLDRLLEILP